MFRAALFVTCLGLAAVAEETPAVEKGPVPTTIVTPGELEIPARAGDVETALRTFVRAHEAHEKGDLDAALRGYLAYLGIEARLRLPPRYEATVRRRLRAMLARIRTRYGEACRLYERDRAAGRRALRALAEAYPFLPEGEAAQGLWQSDALHEAMAIARALDAKGERERAARELEAAIRRLPAALYRYGAKSLLIRLGGPDLFEPEERVGERRDDRGEEEKKATPEDEGETTIEMGE
jgi:tetratricopeptide (TPR) repeat protein